MDGRRFDRIARTLAHGTNRRRALEVLAGWLLAVVGRSSSWQTAAAQLAPDPATCTQDADCLDGDLDPCTGGACVEGLCTYFIVDCIPGHVCCGDGACCPTGNPGSCLADADCVPISADPCEGVRCEGGACVPFLVTCAPDFACCANGACCPGAQGQCAVDGDCPAFPSPLGTSARCVSGVCVPTAPAT